MLGVTGIWHSLYNKLEKIPSVHLYKESICLCQYGNTLEITATVLLLWFTWNQTLPLHAHSAVSGAAASSPSPPSATGAGLLFACDSAFPFPGPSYCNSFSLSAVFSISSSSTLALMVSNSTLIAPMSSESRPWPAKCLQTYLYQHQGTYNFKV